jgi:hypothetical protein
MGENATFSSGQPPALPAVEYSMEAQTGKLFRSRS